MSRARRRSFAAARDCLWRQLARDALPWFRRYKGADDFFWGLRYEAMQEEFASRPTTPSGGGGARGSFDAPSTPGGGAPGAGGAGSFVTPGGSGGGGGSRPTTPGSKAERAAKTKMAQELAALKHAGTETTVDATGVAHVFHDADDYLDRRARARARTRKHALAPSPRARTRVRSLSPRGARVPSLSL